MTACARSGRGRLPGKLCCKRTLFGGRIADRLWNVGRSQDPSSPLFAEGYDKDLDSELDKWAGWKLHKKMNSMDCSDSEQTALRHALAKGRFGLRLDEIVKKCRKLGMLDSVHFADSESDMERINEIEEHASNQRLHEPSPEETERQKKDAFRLLKKHMKGELAVDDEEAEKELEALMTAQVTMKQRGIERRQGGCVSVLNTFFGTVFPAMFCEGERWYHWLLNSSQIMLSVGIYWYTRVLIFGFGDPAQAYDEQELPPIKNIGVLGSFLSFFLVFFASQSYGRFNKQFQQSLACKGRIQDICSIAQASLSSGAAHRLWRHVNAAHMLAYIGLTEPNRYSVSSLLKPLQREHRLLTDVEWKMFVAASMKDGNLVGGAAFCDLIAWSVQDIELAREPREDIEFWEPAEVENVRP